MNETQYEFTERMLREAGPTINVESYLKAIRLAIEWGRKNPANENNFTS
jgi:hypothetical protein